MTLCDTFDTLNLIILIPISHLYILMQMYSSQIFENIRDGIQIEQIKEVIVIVYFNAQFVYN